MGLVPMLSPVATSQGVNGEGEQPPHTAGATLGRHWNTLPLSWDRAEEARGRDKKEQLQRGYKRDSQTTCKAKTLLISYVWGGR